MEKNRSVINVYKTESEKTVSIINNIIIMLSNRIYIDEHGKKQPLLNYDDAISKVIDYGNNTFSVKTNTNDVYAIKIIYQKILAIGKQSMISEFIKEYIDNKKIIVATNYNNKIVDFVVRQGAQIFKEFSFLQNIILQHDQPTFELLSPTEMVDVQKEYNISTYTTPKILKSDPITKYYGLQKDDFIRVITYSPTSGFSTSYQVVS